MKNNHSILSEERSIPLYDGNVNIHSCHITNLTAGKIPYHEHQYWEMAFSLNGEFVCYCDGHQSHCNAHDPELFLIPIAAEHRRVFTQDCSVFTYIFTFSSHHLSKELEQITREQNYSFKLNGLLAQLQRRIRQYFKNETQFSPEFYPILCKLFLIEFLQTYLSTSHSEPNIPLHWRHLNNDEKASQIHEYILSNIGIASLTQDIARHFQLSKKQLNRIYQKKWNISLKEGIKNTRLEHARMLLVNSEADISDIARHLGFFSRAGFYLFFRKYNQGITPGEYRKKFSGALPE